jgi:hypothetical protein
VTNKSKSKARELLDKDRDSILWLFDGRCLICDEYTNTIHEIVPISHGIASLRMQNRVPLCNKHHLMAHQGTNISIPLLQEARRKFLLEKFELDV